LSLVLGLINTAVMCVLLMPMYHSDDPAMKGGLVGGMVGMGCGLCFGLIVQGALLFVMTRPEVKAAFEAH
jgi:hypothetical protein